MTDKEDDLKIIELLNQQYKLYVYQRDQMHINLQQLNGVVFAYEEMIKKHQEVIEKLQSDDDIKE